MRGVLPPLPQYLFMAWCLIKHMENFTLDSRRGLGIFLFTTVSRTALGPTQPPIQWVAGVLSLGVERPARELTTHLHLVPRSRMHGAIPPFPQYIFMARCLVKHRDNFTFVQYVYTCMTPHQIKFYKCTRLRIKVFNFE
jgi:hypothetical protein